MLRKFYPTGLRSVDVEKRTAEFVISDATIDRHGTVLDSNWDLTNYNLNGIVGYQHEVYGGGFLKNSDPDSIIGKSQARWDGDKLIASVEFEPKEMNALAEKILQKVKFGTLKAASVGFMPLEEGEKKKIKIGETEKDVFHFGKRELLEWSIVNIPSNPRALARGITSVFAGAKIENSHEVITEFGETLYFEKDKYTEEQVKKYLDDNKIKFITFEPAEKKEKILLGFQKSNYLCRTLKLAETEI